MKSVQTVFQFFIDKFEQVTYIVSDEDFAQLMSLEKKNWFI